MPPTLGADQGPGEVSSLHRPRRAPHVRVHYGSHPPDRNRTISCRAVPLSLFSVPSLVTSISKADSSLK